MMVPGGCSGGPASSPVSGCLSKGRPSNGFVHGLKYEPEKHRAAVMRSAMPLTAQNSQEMER